MLFSIRSPLELTVPGKMTYASVLAIVKSNEIALLVPDGAQPASCSVVLPVIVPICTSPKVASITTVPDIALPKLYVVERNDLTAALLISVLAILLSIATPVKPCLSTALSCSSNISKIISKSLRRVIFARYWIVYIDTVCVNCTHNLCSLFIDVFMI